MFFLFKLFLYFSSVYEAEQQGQGRIRLRFRSHIIC